MAAPAYQTTGTLSHDTGAVTPSAPSGLTAGDIEFLLCESANEAITLTTANGFTQVSGSPISVPNADALIATRGALFWRRWNGTDGDPVVADPGDHVLAQRYRFNGAAAAGDPWDFVVTSSEATEDTSGSATGGTTLGADRLIVVFVGSAKPDSTGTAELSSFTNANLTSVTERADNAGSSGNGGHIGMATGVKAAAGATGATTYTKATSGYKWHFVIALKPTANFTVVEFHNGTAWVDITSDCIFDSANWSGGIRGAGPTDRVAVPGGLELQMKNGTSNSAGLVGYYSPNHANKRTGWAIGAKIRIVLTSGANTRYWLYRVKEIRPVAGSYRDRRVDVTAKDYISELSERKVSGLTIQTNKTGGELLPLLIARLPFAPTNTSYGTGVFTFPYAFHDERDETTYAISVAQKISQSDMSYIYNDGNSTDGETVKYEPHTTRMNTTTSAATLNDTMTELEVIHSNQNVWNYVLANTYPVEVGDSTVTLGAIRQEFTLHPSETLTIQIPYLDETTERRISGERLVPPVAGTDYKMSSYANNGGSDLNANLTVTPTTGANSMSVIVTNGGTATGYINTLQIRGYGIHVAEKIGSISSNSTSITTYGEKSLTFNMPYQSNAAFGQAVADEIIRRYKNPISTIGGVTFNANRSATLMGYALTLGIGSRITITETVTGINTDFFINGFDYELLTGTILQVTWLLENAFNFVNYFTIGDATLGEIDGPYLIAPF
jgi:hypothetical protein